MSKVKKREYDKILDSEMKALMGKRDWKVWKTDIEPEMYNSILHAMYCYGKKKWVEAQRSANNARRRNEFGRYPAKTVTMFHP